MSNLQRRLCDLPRRMRSATEPVSGTHPLLADLFDVLQAHRRSLRSISLAAGHSGHLLYGWAAGTADPTIGRFNDVLNVLGYELKIVRKE